MKKYYFLVFALLLGILLAGCSDSGGKMPPTAPSDLHQGQWAANATCLGLWQVQIDPVLGKADITQLRQADLILNVLGFLEPPKLSGLTIDFPSLVIDPVEKHVGVDVILKHPLNNTLYFGFDVRGVVFGPVVTNADGLTLALSPEFFSGVPLGYIDGLLGVSHNEANYTGLGGYKYFCGDLGTDENLADFFSNPANLANRGVFPNGTQLKRHYDLIWKDIDPPLGFMVFNYAVYANYFPPTGTPPYGIEDFDIIKANSAEAFCASVNEIYSNLYNEEGVGGGNISLEIEVWDWQEDIVEVTIESAGVIAKTSGTYSGSGTDKSSIYEFDMIPGIPTQPGDLDILITATDPRTFGGVWYFNLLPPTNPMHDIPVYNCWIHTTHVNDFYNPCEDMESFETYEAFVLSGDPWTYLHPEIAGVTCSRDSSIETYIISAVLRYYPVTFYTFGASLADSSDPLLPDVYYSDAYWITTDIACDSKNNIYMVRWNDPDPPHTVVTSNFNGTSFTDPTDVQTFTDEIVRLAVDDEDNPIVLVKNGSGTVYTIRHRIDDVWNSYPVNGTIVSAGIRDFDYNPVQDHYVFVCSITAIRLFAQDSEGNILFTDNELFGTLPMTFIPSIYIDQDDPDCHIVTWGTLDSATSFGRPIARFVAKDYTMPKVVGSLTMSSSGASTIGGAYAPGSSYMFVPAYDDGGKQGLGRLTVPSDW